MQPTPEFDPLEGVGAPGVCWVCQQPYDFRITDFEADGPHASCASKARRMEAGFAAQRETRTLTNRHSVNWLDQRAVQW